MNFSKIPVGLLIIMVIVAIIILIEAGYRFGKMIFLKRTPEKDGVVSSISGYVLALIAFIMAFTFSIVSSRYDTKKSLVREESNIIRTVWFRSDFLPDSDRVATKRLLISYVDTRLVGIQTKNEAAIEESLVKCRQIQQLLWNIAVANGHKDLNSDVAALYVEALNDMITIHYTRVGVSLYARVPGGIWLILMIMVTLGMMMVGYMSAITGSNRSWAFIILAMTFAMVVGMLYTMDKLYSPFTPISQLPMQQLLDFMRSNL